MHGASWRDCPVDDEIGLDGRDTKIIDGRRREAEPLRPVDPRANRSKVGRRIRGVPVLGTSDDLPRIMRERKPSEVLVAIPRADEATRRSVLGRLDRYNVPVKTLPRLHELRECAVRVEDIRDISLQDLLSRGRVGMDLAPIRSCCAVAVSL